MIGLQSLTVAAPQQELMNAAGGSLLTQGMLKVTSGDVTNAGTWQGQSILLNAQSLINSGAIQSADALQLMLVKISLLPRAAKSPPSAMPRYRRYP